MSFSELIFFFFFFWFIFFKNELWAQSQLHCSPDWFYMIAYSSLTGNVVRGPRPTLWRWRHRATLCWLISLLILKCSGLGFWPSTGPSPSLMVTQPGLIQPHAFTPALLICFGFFSYQMWWRVDCRQRKDHLSPSPQLLSPRRGLQVDHQGLPPPHHPTLSSSSISGTLRQHSGSQAVQ